MYIQTCILFTVGHATYYPSLINTANRCKSSFSLKENIKFAASALVEHLKWPVNKKLWSLEKLVTNSVIKLKLSPEQYYPTSIHSNSINLILRYP